MHKISLLFIALLVFSACGENTGKTGSDRKATLQEGELQQVKISGKAQGTIYNITYYTDSGKNMKPATDSLLKQIDRSLSLWEEGSLINQMNTHDTNEVVIHDTHNYITDNFKKSREVYVTSKGAFDPTVGPLIELWGFGSKDRGEITDEEIKRLLPVIGFEFDQIRLTQFDSSKTGGPVRLFYRSDPEISIDFNGIAQGYSVDLLAELFEKNNIRDHMIELGGEIKTSGSKPEGNMWKIGIDKPVDNSEKRTIQIAMELDNRAAATSGSYRKYFEKDGEKFSHTINPETGRPVKHNLISVTVVADKCIDTDAYGTAFMVMGTEKTKEFIRNNPDLNLEVYLIYDENGSFQVWESEGMKQITQELDN